MDFVRENALVLQLCQFEEDNGRLLEKYLSNEDLDLPYVLGQLQFNRVGGIAYAVLNRHGLLKKLHREVRNALRTTYENNRIKTECFRETEVYLAKILHGVCFKYALLKGAYLVQLYPQGFRTSNDIDILIQEKDLASIEKLLKEAGFKQGNVRNDVFEPASRAEIISSRINRGETVPWIKEVNWSGQKFIEIDLNFSLDYKPNNSTDLVDDFLERSCPDIHTSNGDLFTLSTVNFFIQLCTHLYKEASTMAWVKMKRDLSLYKFVDIYLFINRFFNEGFIEKLGITAEQIGVTKECLYTVVRTRELFDIQNPVVDKLIDTLSTTGCFDLNQVYDPTKNRFYRFNMDFKEWMFYPNRIAALEEVEK